jgi:hypothetical protein
MLRMIAPRTKKAGGAGTIDILDELGLTHTQKVYERRVEAVATPAAYNTARKTEWDKLTAAVKKAYDDTVANAELISSGISLAARQELAVNASKMTYATQNAILEANFPSGAQAIALEASGRGQFPGTIGNSDAAPRRRAAPAKPRKSRAKPKA